MNLRKTVIFFAIILTLAAAAFATYWFWLKGEFKKHLGLDLQGGLRVVLQAKDTKVDNLDDAMNKARDVIEERVNKTGVTEPIVQREGANRIIVELAGIKDPEAALDLIGSTAKLEFYDGDGKLILTGDEVKDAIEAEDQARGGYVVNLTFTGEGQKKFSEATRRLVNKYPEKFAGDRPEKRQIAIMLDKKVLTSPYVTEVINTPTAEVTGFSSREDAFLTSVKIRSGALPLSMDVVEKQTVGPTLGKDYLDRSTRAGIYGVLAILIFMLVYYRLPGLLANFTLVLYMVLVMIVLLNPVIDATLTLPGIAGFLLSIGMAVDANVIIYERLKEELRSGKTLVSAIDSGFKRAFTTILDSNVTTLIAAAVLAYFGTSVIRGFAVTLSIGILTSMFTALTVTRWLLRLMAQTRIITNTKFYGA